MEDHDLDRFMKESSKSYKECKVKNSARRHSLVKKTLGLEVEHKMARAELSREERHLREQLKQMQLERTKTTIRERSNSKSKSKKNGMESCQKKPVDLDLDPYPITFGQASPVTRSRANTLDNKGKKFVARRVRRQSKEFEDLHLNTATGKLAISRLQILASHSGVSTPYSLSPGVTSPYTLSPSTPRRRVDSNSSVDSNGEQYWVGNPQAIGSVRRARKTVEEQEKDRQAMKEAKLHNGR